MQKNNATPTSNMKSFVVPLILTVLIIGSIAYYLVKNIDQYRKSFIFSSTSIIELAVLAVASVSLNGWNNYVLYHSLHVKIPYFESAGLSALNSIGNQLPIPGGGLVISSLVLKRYYHLDYLKFLSSAIAFYVISVAANGLIGISILLWMKVVIHFKVPVVLWLGFGAMCLTPLIFKFPIEKLRLPAKWQQRLSQALNGWNLIRTNKIAIVKVLGIQILALLVYSLELKIAFKLFSQSINFGQSTLFASSNILTQLISITPDAVGIRESLIGGIASLLGFELGTSILAVGVIRLIVFPVILIVGLIFLPVFIKKFGSLVKKEDEGTEIE